jgi:hypothetical protein
MALNESIPFRKPNNEATVTTTAAVTGKRFVGLSTAISLIGDNVKVTHATAGSRPYGVSGFDAPSGSTVLLVHTGPGMEVPVTADGSITAGTEVEVGTAGKAKTLASGRPAGLALSTAADGADVRVKLY